MMLATLQAELAETLLSEQVQTDIVTPATHLAIYRNNITKNFIDTLSSIYPLLLKLLGADYFAQIAKEYIQHYPLRSSNLHDYGEYFPEFLCQFPALDHFPYLVDTARFEWICHSLHFTPDAVGLDLNVLEKISSEEYEDLHFSLNPASYLEKFDWPILEIIELCEQDTGEILPVNEQVTYLHMMRRDEKLLFSTLSKAEYTFLTALQNNVPLARALELTLSIDPDFKLETVLPRWIREQVIVDCWI